MRPKKRQPLSLMGWYMHVWRFAPFGSQPGSSCHARNGQVPSAIALSQHTTSAGLYPCQCQMCGSFQRSGLARRGWPGHGCTKGRALKTVSSSRSHPSFRCIRCLRLRATGSNHSCSQLWSATRKLNPRATAYVSMPARSCMKVVTLKYTTPEFSDSLKNSIPAANVGSERA